MSRSIPLAIFLWLGLGSFPFAHHYSENRFFTFFSSGYLDVSVPRVPLRTLLIHVRIPSHYQRWVPSFGNLRIEVHLQLPVAYRSLSRPSSAPSAKASTIRSSSLNRLVFKSIAFLQFTNFYLKNRLISVFPQQNIILWFCVLLFDIFLFCLRLFLLLWKNYMQLSRYEFYVPFIKNRKKKSNKSTSYKFILSA